MFVKYAMDVVPPGRAFESELVGEWNAAHPGFLLSFLHAREDWPMFRSFATPTFYFFRDGQLVATVEGWPKEGRRDALIAAAQTAGIKVPAH